MNIQTIDHIPNDVMTTTITMATESIQYEPVVVVGSGVVLGVTLVGVAVLRIANK